MSNAYVEIAEAALSRTEFERMALSEIERRIGFDVAFFANCEEPSRPTVIGFDTNPLGDEARAFVYGEELRAVKASALCGRGVAVDAEVLGTKMRECSYYRDLVAPRGGGASFLVYLRLRGEVRGLVMLGRCGSSARFTRREIEVGEAELAPIAVAHASYRDPRSSVVSQLTPRESELVDYLCLGYTNREIALACGLSPNTVRNQLSRVFDKIGASTRAEAVAIIRA